MVFSKFVSLLIVGLAFSPRFISGKEGYESALLEVRKSLRGGGVLRPEGRNVYDSPDSLENPYPSSGDRKLLVPSGSSDTSPDDSSDNSPDDSLDKSSDTSPDGSPDDSSETSPDDRSDNSPDDSLDKSSDTSPDGSPDGSSDTSPDASPDDSLDKSSDTSPDASPDDSPSSDTSPDDSSDNSPDDSPDTTHARAYKYPPSDPFGGGRKLQLFSPDQ